MSIPLSEQLAWAARGVLAVRQGESLGVALQRVPLALRPGVQALVFHGLRHGGEAEVLTGLLVAQAPRPLVAALLGLALSLLLEDEALADNTRYDPHVVVDQTVYAREVLRLPVGVSGLLNACLRRFLRERDTLLAQARQDAVARWNHPFWWVRQLRRDHPAHWQDILRAAQQPAPMVLRVNRRQATVAQVLAQLQAQGITAWPAGPDGIELAQGIAVERLPGWAQGWLSVQDSGAQHSATLLAPHLAPGARVLDACAAPGGKTAHLLEVQDLDLLALDIDPERCQRIHDNLARLQLQAQVQAADAAQPARWWDGRPFDAILLDAPCTASGIVRRHPDVRWLRRPEDSPRLAQTQAQLLEALWPLLRPGGHLLYATCSVFRDEGERQVGAFLARHPDAQRAAAPGHLMPGQVIDGLTGPGGTDGFFYALLQRQA